jgi:uncharacterized protein YbaR (Trm112 family)
MDDAVKESYPIRCPVCLHAMQVDKSTPFHREIACQACKRSFAFRDALPPVKEHAAVPDPGTNASPETFGRNTLILLIGIPAAAFSIGWAGVYHRHLSGPAFLFFIAIVLIVTLPGSFLLRIHWYDSHLIGGLGFLTFEGISVHRLIWGYLHGMRVFSKYDRHAGGCGGGFGGGCAGGCGGGCGGCGGCGG